MKLKTFKIALLFLFSLSVYSQEIVKGPPSKVTEQDFFDIASRLEKLYIPFIKNNYQVDFVIEKDWKDNTVNSYATREIDTFKVHILGGIARASGMTRDSLALVICHEIGHHLGGAPKTFLYDRWPSAEGQADYFATSKCLKKYYQEYSFEEVPIDRNIPEKVMADCRARNTNGKEEKICIKVALASLAFADFLNNMPNNKIKVDLLTPDTREVKGTNTNDYPRPQCRFDTLYAGTMCNAHPDSLFSNTDPNIGACTTTPGSRPLCWYKP